MNTTELLALTMVKGIGDSFIKKNREYLMKEDVLFSIVSNKEKKEVENIQKYIDRANDLLNESQKKGFDVISIFSKEYPQKLLELNNPPSFLYLIGRKALLENAIAIIGTRHSTALGNRIANRIGNHFSQHYSICNGLAEGIDENAILNANGAFPNVVGVISGGIDYTNTCTHKHCSTIDKVLSAGGLILSEFPIGQKEDKYSGSKASRIQAGLSKALILVQSSTTGGSKYTLEAFAKLNRPLGIVQYVSSEEYIQDKSFGANRLILEKREMGLAEFIGSKKTTSIAVKKIIPIQSVQDYTVLENSICQIF